ncbi:hypothetical protein ACOZ4F_01270 (plasmid) [Haloarcula marismortui]|uniref:hypothetical protein n=1 Tax=Haloarcula marismortui TaxID=2238 RepID=UPI003C7631B3
MSLPSISVHERLVSINSLRTQLQRAAKDLLRQEFSYSTGHIAAVLNTCLFAPSLLTFWFVNGVLDFSTAIAIGAVATTVGLQIRVLAYLLLVPVFLLIRVSVHLLHPTHRRQVLSGSCPNVQLVSLDWFSMGILATGLPLALQNLGPWVGMNTLIFTGVFLAPRYLPDGRGGQTKLVAIGLGSAVFLYATYGAAVAVLPDPASVLGPVATLALSDETTASLLRVVNSFIAGPMLVGLFVIFMNHLLTRPELTDIPLVKYALPRRDPDTVVSLSAATGTVFYLTVVALLTGQVVVAP